MTELLTHQEQSELLALFCIETRSGYKPSTKAPSSISKESAITAGPAREAIEKSGAKVPKSLQPLPTSVLSPINKNPTPAEKKAIAKKTDLIHSFKTGQMSRLMR